MTGGADSGSAGAHEDAQPTLAQEAGTAISGAVLRLAYMTGARIVQAPPWPGASFTEEQPEPGAGIRIALALERAARAGARVYIQRGREAGMSWHARRWPSPNTRRRRADNGWRPGRARAALVRGV